MNDDRISRYLSDQAEGIALAPADPEGVMRRGSRRRTRRRTALVGSLAVVSVLATSVALRDGGDDQKLEIDLAAPNVVPSAFDWSVVSPDTGLAWSSSSVQLGNSIYSLSTAPASREPNPTGDYGPPTLYRSDDGAEWSQVGSPDGLSVSALAGAGETLYALGTAPAGGRTRDLVVATSTDGAATWSNVTLPRDLAELEARHPGQVMVSQPKLVARDATHLVATIGVSANLDPAQYYPEMNTGARSYSSEWTDTGLVVRDLGPMECTDAAGRMIDPTPTTLADGTTAAQPDEMVCTADARRPGSDEGEVVFEKSYAELGIDEELGGLVGGRSLVYVSDDGATFERVDVPQGDSAWTSNLLATSDGFRMVRDDYNAPTPVATVLSSPDGRTWTVDAELPGSPGSIGLLGDRVAVSLFDESGTHVKIQQQDGTWTDLDLTGAVTPPDGHEVWMSDVAFGPLGLVAVLGSSDRQGNGGEFHVVHSSDGATISVLSLDGLVEDPGGPSGATVTADAIAVRFSNPTDDDPQTPPTQVVLVGTPTG